MCPATRGEGRHPALPHRRRPSCSGPRRSRHISLDGAGDVLPPTGPEGTRDCFVRPGRGPAKPGTRRLLARPPGAGPVPRMASDPVLQAGPGQCPQDAAVPSCSLSDIGRPALSPAALLTQGHSCLALSGAHDPWGNRTETKTCVARGVVGKVLASCELPGPSGWRSFVRSAIHAVPFAGAVTLRKALASSGTARNSLTMAAGVTGPGQPARHRNRGPSCFQRRQAQKLSPATSSERSSTGAETGLVSSRQLNLEPWAGHKTCGPGPQGVSWPTLQLPPEAWALAGGVPALRSILWPVWAQVPPESLWPPPALTAGSSRCLFAGGLCRPAPLLCPPPLKAALSPVPFTAASPVIQTVPGI